MCNEICPTNSIQHAVKDGDTFWRLSQTYGVSVQSIADANPSVNPQNLQIGSTLCIPAAPTQPTPPITPTLPITPAPPMRPVTCRDGTFSYTVKAGDTFWKLSQTYGVSLQSIFDANPGVDPQNLQIGSTLCIPAAPMPPAPPITPTPPMRPVTCRDGTFSHTIQEGDTFWKLSQTYGVSLQSIFDANSGVDPQNLQIGSTLCIPTAPMPPAPPITPTPPTPPAPPNYFAYLVKECDAICGIARKFYVSVDSILEINPGLDPRCLQAGTYIYVPINCCGPNMFRYVVRAGDTLNGIANKFNVCPLDLIVANPNIDFECLVRCQIICIPSA